MSGGGAGGRDREKEVSFEAEWDRLEAEYLVRLRRAATVRGDWRDKLRAVAWEAARLAQADPVGIRFLAVDALAAGRRGQERQRALAERLTAMLDEWRAESGEAPRPESSRWVLGIFFAGFYRCIVGEREEELAAEIPRLMFLAVSPLCSVEVGLTGFDMPPTRQE